jgi:hypothetical protein
MGVTECIVVLIMMLGLAICISFLKWKIGAQIEWIDSLDSNDSPDVAFGHNYV